VVESWEEMPKLVIEEAFPKLLEGVRWKAQDITKEMYILITEKYIKKGVFD